MLHHATMYFLRLRKKIVHLFQPIDGCQSIIIHVCVATLVSTSNQMSSSCMWFNSSAMRIHVPPALCILLSPLELLSLDGIQHTSKNGLPRLETPAVMNWGGGGGTRHKVLQCLSMEFILLETSAGYYNALAMLCGQAVC